MAAVGLALGAAEARAQTELPDAATIAPIVILLVDTSGSMEYPANCACTTSTCTECLPAGVGVPTSTRWSIVVEALTGTIATKTWARETRLEAATYDTPLKIDYGYWIPHFSFTGAQAADGLLDTFGSTVKFGFMTVDAIGTLTTDTPLVTAAAYNPTGGLDPYEVTAATIAGGWSYGQVKSFTIPGCGTPWPSSPTTFAMDSGARNSTAAMGGMVSIACTLNPTYCDDSSGSITAKSLAIQDALFGADHRLDTRPMGGGAIAPLLDDVSYYLNNAAEVTTQDDKMSCRRRYVVLITDSVPGNDMREEPYNCAGSGGSCPYGTANSLAYSLCGASTTTGTCAGKATGGLHVIGFANGDTTYQAALNLLALNGGTRAATFVASATALSSAISAILNSASSSSITTRSVPAFYTNTGTGTNLMQYQISTGFEKAVDPTPWRGIVESRRFQCQADLSLAEIPQDTTCTDGCDRYDQALNARVSARNLLTVIPANAAHMNDYITSSYCSGTAGCGVSTFKQSNAPITYESPLDTSVSATPRAFAADPVGITDAMVGNPPGGLAAVLAWMHGTAGSAREARRLGDTVYSQPRVVGRPTVDRFDPAYNAFRRGLDVANRPTVLYVMSNDGILHGFAVESGTIPLGSRAGTIYKMGDELFGFVPPCVMASLNNQMTTHAFNGDGLLDVKDVYFARQPGQTPTDGYHTVLLAGVGRQHQCYFALDVTDPFAPKFLWQFARPSTDVTHELGKTEGQPALAQLTILGATSGTYQRAVAILPGGAPTTTPGAGNRAASPVHQTEAMIGDTSTQIAARADIADNYADGGSVGASGRQLYILDVASGLMIRRFDSSVLPSPVTGGVGVYSGEVGVIATRAFFTDRDGWVYRLDLAARDPDLWAVNDWFDLFHGGSYVSGNPSFHAPVITQDASGYIVVLVGTGDRSTSSTTTNRIASLREVFEPAPPAAPTTATVRLNWEMGPTGQQVMGPLELMNGYAYFATFKAPGGAGTACNPGSSYIWGVPYVDTTACTPAVGGLDECLTGFPCPGCGIRATSDAATLNSRARGPYANQVIYGVGLTQRPSCMSGSDNIDPYGGHRYTVDSGSPGAFTLVAGVRGAATTGYALDALNVGVTSPYLGTDILSYTPVD